LAPKTGDIVTVRLAGTRVMYLKRVVALAGDTIAFVDGVLVRNGTPVDEPYVNGPCAWQLAKRTVPDGHIYVVGDNRSMPMAQHPFGSVETGRILGGPLW
jgi:signal peptidase I